MNLIQAMQTEYSRCKRLLYSCAFPVSVGLFIAAVVGCFPVPQWLTNTLAVCVVAAQIALFIFREFASDHQSRAEEIRRLEMLNDGLGIRASPISLARLHEIVGDFKHSEPPYLTPYYGSTEPPGPRRLLETTAESAFFTGGNARRMWKLIAATAGVGIVIAIITFVVAVLSGVSSAVAETAARVVLASMAFWAAGDFAAVALAFKSLRDACEAVLHGCEQSLAAVHDGDATAQSALAMFCEYNCALAKAPPIPAWIYARYQERMNTAWRNQRADHGAQPPSSTGTRSS